MRRTSPLLLALALLAVLTGCGTGTISPTPDASASPTAEESPDPIDDPGPEVPELPDDAFLQISVTAVSEEGEELHILLTVDQPRAGAPAARELAELSEACPNAIASQLEIYPGLEPTGVVSATLVVTGEWAIGDRALVSAGPFIANIGVGSGIAPIEDPAAGFGCTAAIVTGPGEARLLSLLLGDPDTDDQVDADLEARRGVYGIEDSADSASQLTWKNCRVQLGERADLIAEQAGWYGPDDWGRGCLIGYGGSA